MKATGFADEEELKKGFSKVEIFLAAFPGDQNIREASVDLIACVLKAVERAILYFLSSTSKPNRKLPCRRDSDLHSLSVSRAMGSMKQDLIDSIDEVPSQTKELMDRVEQSHIWGLQKASGLTLASMFSFGLFSRPNESFSNAAGWL